MYVWPPPRSTTIVWCPVHRKPTIHINSQTGDRFIHTFSMRRSKALPSKTVRNYRSVSQRRMTSHSNDDSRSQKNGDNHDDDEDERQEMERLRRLLSSSSKSSESSVSMAVKGDQQEQHQQGDAAGNGDGGDQAIEACLGNCSGTNNAKAKSNPYHGILSDELVSDNCRGYGTTNDDLMMMIVPSNNEKNKKKNHTTTPTTQEIKEAQRLGQQRLRKLRQLEQRQAQKKLRQSLYTKLQQSSLTTTQRALLQPSSTLGRTMTKKQQLRRLVQKERAGLVLTKDEHDLLYPEQQYTNNPTKNNEDTDNDKNMNRDKNTTSTKNRTTTPSKTTPTNKEYPVVASPSTPQPRKSTPPPQTTQPQQQQQEEMTATQRKRKRRRARRENENDDELLHDVDKQRKTGDCYSTNILEQEPNGLHETSSHDDNNNNNKKKDDVEEKDKEPNPQEYRRQVGGSTNTTFMSRNLNEKETENEKNEEDNDMEGVEMGHATQAQMPNLSESTVTGASASSSSVAAKMMASLSFLKQKQQQGDTKKHNPHASQNTIKHDQGRDVSMKEEEQQQEDDDEQSTMASAFAHHKSYNPGAPIELKTAAALGLSSKPPLPSSTEKTTCIPDALKRPPQIQVARYELPVAAMEFEVLDTIRNHDVTIVCGETGSGKSTQVPQFLYEAGFTLSSSQQDVNHHSSSKEDDNQDKPSPSPPHYLIGITQPRRVAAVSTAKRVCYEMGQGNGKCIRSQRRQGGQRKPQGQQPTKEEEVEDEGNLVSYQTRYETAGLGPATHIKFMTDGILLQEIQTDLLLRKYSVICIDEAHERNLNSDALIGLLSVALPLRRQAASSSSSSLLVPLKLVIMSATLRVSDFTDNPKLFASHCPCPPAAVLKIPGRTFPVTVHHNKITVLDEKEYQEAAFAKVCKIHSKLPAGGILVFLTGKQEIVQMVKRLENTLNRRKRQPLQAVESKPPSWDVGPSLHNKGEEFLRDMDDDEVDGELFAADDDIDDYDDDDDHKSSTEETPAPLTTQDSSNGASKNKNDDDSGIPQKAIVLPLYSMLSTEEQAKVFDPVPEGHRLIVVATNIAETVSFKD